MGSILGHKSMLRTRTTCGKSLVGIDVPRTEVACLRKLISESGGRSENPRPAPAGVVDLRESSDEEGAAQQRGSVELLSSDDEANKDNGSRSSQLRLKRRRLEAKSRKI